MPLIENDRSFTTGPRTSHKTLSTQIMQLAIFVDFYDEETESFYSYNKILQKYPFKISIIQLNQNSPKFLKLVHMLVGVSKTSVHVHVLSSRDSLC